MIKSLLRKSRRTASPKLFTRHRQFTHERLESRLMMTINSASADFRINDVVSGFQNIEESVSSVAVSETAGTLAVYSGKGAGTREGIFLRTFDQDGEANGAAVRVSSTIRGTRSAAVVAANDAGASVVVWQGRGAGDKYGIFLQRFAADGTAAGSEQLVNETVGGRQHSPAVAMADDGSFVVTWSGPSASDPNGIFARRFNADGTPADSEERINTTTTSDQADSDISVNSGGDYVIVWSSRNQDGDDWSVAAQRFNAAGERQGDEFVANTTTAASQNRPSVALQDDGSFMIVWSSFGQDGDSWGIVAQRFDTSGATVGDEIIVNTTTSGHQTNAQVAGARGKYLVTWQSGVADGSGWEIAAQELDSEGNRVGTEMIVNSAPAGVNSGHQVNPSVAFNTAGNGAIVWTGNGTTDRKGVFGKRFVDDEPLDEQQAPDLEAIENQSVAPNSELSVTVRATDPNAGDTLTYQLDPTGSPAGATIERIDNNTAIIRWTPTNAERSSVVSFRVLVTDDGDPPLSDAETFEANVTDGGITLDLNGSDEPGTDSAAEFGRNVGAALIVQDDLQIVGAENNLLNTAGIFLENAANSANETLSADVLDTNISANYDSDLGRLLLTGEDTVENYVRVLETLRYNNTAVDATGTRRVTIRVVDDSTVSNVAGIDITIGDADLVSFAQAVADSGTQFFGAAWCPACTAQKELFEDGSQFLPFVEVTDAQRDRNQVGDDNNIDVYPTWVFPDGSRLEQAQSLQTIAERSGVSIPIGENPFVAPVADDTLLIGSPLHIPLDGYDPNGGQLTYSVATSDPNVTAEILSGNRSARIDVAGYGDLVFEIFEQRASRPSQRFLELANDDFYDGIIFHRVINDFVIQGGDPLGTGTGGSTLGDFDDQFHVDLQHNRTGLLSYAKSADDTNDSQFFITEGDSASLRNLDFNHSIFGILVEGEDNRAAISDTSVIRQSSDFPPGSRDRRIDRPGRRDDETEFNITMEDVEVFEDQENAVLLLRAAPGTTGDVTVTVTVSDEQGNTFERQFVVTVQEDLFNGRPFLGDIAPVSTTVNTPAQFQLTATDVEGDDFAFTAVRRGTVPYTFDVSDSGLVTVTPPTDFVGTMEIEVRVGRTASSGDFDSQLVSIEVT